MQNGQVNESPAGGLEPPEQGWFDKPKNINRLIRLLIGVCLALVLADLFYTNNHPHFEWETVFGLQAWIGFIAFIVIVFLGRLLRLIVRRPENYYD
jgi:hypothetical protein